MASANDGIRFRQFSPVSANFTTPSTTQPITFQTDGTSSPILIRATDETSPITIQTDGNNADITLQTDNNSNIILYPTGDFSKVSVDATAPGGFFEMSASETSSVTVGSADTDSEAYFELLIATPRASQPGGVAIGVDALPSMTDGDISLLAGASTGDIDLEAPAGSMSLTANTTFRVNAETSITLDAEPSGFIYLDAGDYIQLSAGGNLQLLGSGAADLKTTAGVNHYIRLVSGGGSVAPADNDIIISAVRSGSGTDDGSARITSGQDVIIQALSGVGGIPDPVGGGILLDVQGEILTNYADDVVASDQQGKVTVCTTDGFESHVGQFVSGTEKINRLSIPVRNHTVLGGSVAYDLASTDYHLLDQVELLGGATEPTVAWFFERLPWDISIVGIKISIYNNASGTLTLNDVFLLRHRDGGGTGVAIGDGNSISITSTGAGWLHGGLHSATAKFIYSTGEPNFDTESLWLSDGAANGDTRTFPGSGDTFATEGCYSLFMEGSSTSSDDLVVSRIIIAFRARGSYP